MPRRVEPRHYFLNERHELSRTQRDGGGSLPKLGEINWQSKQRRLSTSLRATREALEGSKDPLRGHRYFLLARPESTVPKLTDDKRKAPSGRFDEPVDYAGKDSRILGRLGLDVLSVTDQGAMVHATPERIDHLTSVASRLNELGRLEQARWAYVAGFAAIPRDLRADSDWLETLATRGQHEAIVEVQPLLSRQETALVVRTIADQLSRPQGESIIGTGTDFSGRSWVRAILSSRSILEILDNFFSIQSVHRPLLSAIAASSRHTRVRPRPEPGNHGDPSVLPVVGVVDSGVAQNHAILQRFRRGSFIHPGSQGVFDNHGTFVTSRVVFGDPADPIETPAVPGFRFVDVVVSKDAASVEDKVVVEAIETVATNYPDCRVFNLSFGDYVAVDLHAPVERKNRLDLTQDLDNLIFKRDLLVVVAAGNSRPGILPSEAYPNHWRDPAWGVGNWAAGFNTLKCGSFVREATALRGVADIPYAPSPFSKAGPGIAGAPIPDFSDHGGNCNSNYARGPGHGVYGLNPSGQWEDRIGTSFAAPLLSRQCASAIRSLERVCPPGTQPFGVTVKAFLAMTAGRPTLPSAYEAAAAVTLGAGQADAERLDRGRPSEALFVWQGVLADKTDVARIIVPVPRAWIVAAQEPVCDVSIAWDTPVNAAFPRQYGCRQVDIRLRPTPDADAIRPSHGPHRWYPLRIRSYKLKQTISDRTATNDPWLLEVSYSEICDYLPTMDFSPEQRIAVVIRLEDKIGSLDPHEAIQSHRMVDTMTHLSAAMVPARAAVLLRTQS